MKKRYLGLGMQGWFYKRKSINGIHHVIINKGKETSGTEPTTYLRYACTLKTIAVAERH